MVNYMITNSCSISNKYQVNYSSTKVDANNIALLKSSTNVDADDIKLLQLALENNSGGSINYFRKYYAGVLPERSILARLVEKIVNMIPSFIRPLSHTGLARREIERAKNSVTELEYKSNGSKTEQTFNEFNLTPPVPYYTLQLGYYQRKALINLLDNQLQDQNKASLTENNPVFSLAVKYLSFQYTLAELSVEERTALDEVNFQATQRYLNDIVPVLNDPASGINQHAQQAKTYQAYHYKNALVAEILSKSLAYNGHINDKEIAIPVDIGGTMKLVNYKIQQKYLGNQLPFYVLTPLLTSSSTTSQNPLNMATLEEIEQYAQPWVVIRGTEPLLEQDKEGAKESIAADVKDSKGVSALPIWHRYDELLVFLANTYDQPKPKKFNITGHSLGGTLAQAMAVIYNPLVDQTFAFNSPGVDEDIHNYAKQLDKQVQDKIVVFHRAGDIVSSASPKRIGQNFEISNVAEKEQNDAFVKHSDMMLNTPHRQRRVDIQKDEKNWMRRFSDWNRRHILSKVSHLVVDANTFGWFKNRHQLRDFASAYFSCLKKTQEKSIAQAQ
jgi:hypothetical protein